METKPRAAIYARVSTQGQKDEKTIQSQLDELPIYAKGQGWKIHSTYIDEGMSGSFIEGREDFKRLLVDMEAKKFDILLVAEHSRVTRTGNPEERGRILKLLKDNAIKLASPHEGLLDLSMFSGDLMTTLKLMFAAEERQEINRRLKRGKRQRLREGSYVQPHVPYGLKRISDRTVRPPVHNMLINEDEAHVVRMTYDLIVNEGKTIGFVTDYLNSLGIRSRPTRSRPRGSKWSPGMVQAILRNKDTLTGTIVSNRHDWKQTGNGKFKLLGETPESEWIRVPVPAIFTKEEYKRLDERIAENRVQGRPRISESGFLLRGKKIRCAECGRVFGPRWVAPKGKKPLKYYACGGRVVQSKFMKEGEKKCDMPFVNQGIIDTMVWNDLVVKLFMFPQETLKNWAQATDIKQGVRKNLEARLQRTEKEIKSREAQVDKLLDQSIGGLFPPDKIKAKKDELDKALSVLRDEKVGLEGELKKVRQSEENKKAMDGAVGDLTKLAGKLSSKMNKMGVSDRQRLIDYYLPKGTYLEIHHLHPDDYYVVDLGPRRKIHVRWGYSLRGVFDLKALIGVLKVYDKEGKIPEYDSYLRSNYISQYLLDNTSEI